MRLGPHRLGAVERQPPTAQVERGSLLGRDLAHAQVVGEVRPAADRAAIARDRLQPAERLLQERHRRHQHVGLADVQRLQDAADQAHVVIAGQPKHAAAAARVLEGISDQRRVVHQVGVRQHDALGRAGRAGRVLQEGQRVAVHVRLAPIVAAPCRQLVGRQPVRPASGRASRRAAAARAPTPGAVVSATLASASSAIAWMRDSERLRRGG